jgi:hypothetical protein
MPHRRPAPRMSQLVVPRHSQWCAVVDVVRCLLGGPRWLCLLSAGVYTAFPLGYGNPWGGPLEGVSVKAWHRFCLPSPCPTALPCALGLPPVAATWVLAAWVATTSVH